MRAPLAKFGLSEKNENFRGINNYPTIASMLDGKKVEDIIPKPLKCKCGNYPTINKINKIHNVRCMGCGINYDFERNYSASILQWNLKANVPFCVKVKSHFHPYINILITDELYVIRAATKAMNQKLFKQKNTKSKRERNLISLMIDWNNFSVRMSQLLKQNPSKFVERLS